MKTYLTDNEFVEVFWREMTHKMDATYSAGTGDKIAWYLFREFEKDVKDTLAGSMHGIGEFEGDDAKDLIGYQFHKTFRQTDPIDARYINAIVWSCLQDAPVFWKCMDKACKILISEELSEHYRELIEE